MGGISTRTNAIAKEISRAKRHSHPLATTAVEVSLSRLFYHDELISSIVALCSSLLPFVSGEAVTAVDDKLNPFSP